MNLRRQPVLTDSEIIELATPKLREKLGPFGFDHAEVRSGYDHDGYPVVYMDAIYRDAAPEFDPKLHTEVVVATLHSLQAEGDDRFVHLRHVYPGEEPAIDDDFGDPGP